jgi:Tfp pilus assembly protein PilZ
MDVNQSERAASPPNVLSAWSTGASFLANYTETEGGASLFHPLPPGESFPASAPVGTVVSLVIRFLDRDVAFHLHAEVVEWRDDAAIGRGLVLRLLDQERPRRDMVVGCAEGEEFPYVRRRHERLPCFFSVTAEYGLASRFHAIATDISEGGAFLATEEELQRGTPVAVWLNVPNQPSPLAFVGTVAHTQRQAGQRGVGIEFQFRSQAERVQIAEQLRLLRNIMQRERAKSLPAAPTRTLEEFRILNARVRAESATPEQRERWACLKQEYLSFLESAKGYRRHFQRSTLAMRISVHCGQQYLEAAPVDLSAGGIRLTMPGPYAIGSTLTLALQFPDDPQLRTVTARVVWTGERNLTGLEFVDVPQQLQDSFDARVWSEVIASGRWPRGAK